MDNFAKFYHMDFVWKLLKWGSRDQLFINEAKFLSFAVRKINYKITAKKMSLFFYGTQKWSHFGSNSVCTPWFFINPVFKQLQSTIKLSMRCLASLSKAAACCMSHLQQQGTLPYSLLIATKACPCSVVLFNKRQ